MAIPGSRQAGSRRTFLGGLAATAAGAIAPASAKPPLGGIRDLEVASRSITSFGRAGRQQTRFGKLEFRGGLTLTSPDKDFGGWSGLLVAPGGSRMLAVSDEGSWLSAEIDYKGDAPAGLRGARIGPIAGIAGRQLNAKRDLDAEALALAEGDLSRGQVLIGFERNHRIGRFPVINGAVQAPSGYLRLPPEARRMRSNKGFEAVTVLAGGPYKGAVVAFSERFPDNPAQHTGWIWIAGEPRRLGYRDAGEFEVTDAASLPDGSLLVLERRFRWTEGVKMRLRSFPFDEIRPGNVMQGETLVEADLSYEIDNMEGLAVHRTPEGDTVITMISDDNFNSFLQRTILLQFTLTDVGRAARRA
jgi:hypothetical protein